MTLHITTPSILPQKIYTLISRHYDYDFYFTTLSIIFSFVVVCLLASHLCRRGCKNFSWWKTLFSYLLLFCCLRVYIFTKYFILFMSKKERGVQHAKITTIAKNISFIRERAKKKNCIKAGSRLFAIFFLFA